uniref:Uncharacterized protein n=1 Tax=Favella ehrenbergii TaxID=182087 RepID=A0A7S3HXP6_9SPIT
MLLELHETLMLGAGNAGVALRASKLAQLKLGLYQAMKDASIYSETEKLIRLIDADDCAKIFGKAAPANKSTAADERRPLSYREKIERLRDEVRNTAVANLGNECSYL